MIFSLGRFADGDAEEGVEATRGSQVGGDDPDCVEARLHGEEPYLALVIGL